MMENREILKLIVRFGFMIGAAFLAARHTSKRFRSERFWDRKAKAYSELIDARHHMKFHTNENYDAFLENRDIAEDYAEDLWKSYRKARNHVVSLLGSSRFLISGGIEGAVIALEKDLGSARHSQHWLENLETKLAAIKSCLKLVKDVGARELETGV
ncbi:MAG: hypothetical protein ACI8Z1_001424 [Candidatus Azotimanducaceae bacterium]|jgi:hypothetical protein